VNLDADFSPSRQFWRGVRAELPLLVGVFPFGLIYGVIALDAGLTRGAAQAASAIIFAGSSQFVFAQLVHSNAPALVILVSIFIVNLRHALYSASIAPYFEKLPGRWKPFLAYLLTDEAYAVAIVELRKHPNAPNGHWLYIGAGLALWATWQASTAAGVFLGAAVPSTWALDFTLALTFIAMVIPLLRDRPSTAAALVAGITALLGYDLPFKLGLVAAALAGILTGTMLEKRQ
jgi:4-azaleucine resistance transporter AzlC